MFVFSVFRFWRDKWLVAIFMCEVSDCISALVSGVKRCYIGFAVLIGSNQSLQLLFYFQGDADDKRVSI